MTPIAEIPIAAPGRWPSWLRLGMIDVLLVALAACLILHSRGSLLDDPGVGWHLRNVDAMWAEGGWLWEDSFSGPQGGQPWRSNQWIGDGLLRFGWWWGGLEGIAAVTIIVLLVMFRALYAMLRRDGVPRLAAVVWTGIGAVGTSPAWLARPNIFTVMFVMLTAWVLDRYHRGACTWRQTLWLMPLAAIWANTHGGFIVCLMMLAAAWLIEAFLALGVRYNKEHRGARRRLVHLSLLLPGVFLCTLINPYGWTLYPWVLQLLGSKFFMNLNMEWLSPDFHSPAALCWEPLILLLPVLIAMSRRRPSLMALGLSVLWLHMALSGFRYVAPWVVVTVPLLARLSVEVPWLRAVAGRLNRSERREPAGADPRDAGCLGIVLIAAVLLGGARGTDGFSYHDPKHIPTKALTHLLEHHDGRPTFHSYAWGGWLTWHGWPEFKNWIDDRNPVQGKAHVVEYTDILNARPGWEEKLARYGVELVCIAANSPLAYQLSERTGWREIYCDDYAVIFEAR